MSNPPKLNQKQIDSYFEQGFIVLEKAIPPNVIQQIQSETQKVFSYSFKKENHSHPDELNDNQPFSQQLASLFKYNIELYLGTAKLANHMPALHNFASSQYINNILSQLGISLPSICARPLMWFHCKSLATTERYHRLPAHQEWSNMQGSLSGIVAWFPLAEISESMGPLQVIPMSHRSGLLDFFERKEKDYSLAIDDSQLSSQFIEVKLQVSDLLLFHPLLIHRSGENKTDDVRWTANYRINNVGDPDFIKRNFTNPFLYQAPEKLVDDWQPTSSDIEKSIQWQRQQIKDSN